MTFPRRGARVSAPGTRDRIDELRYAVPEDDAYLRDHRPSYRMTGQMKEARKQYTDFFHVPGCYAETTNLSQPPENISPVNAKIFEVFKRDVSSGASTRFRFGHALPESDDFAFFRFTLQPVRAEDSSQAQDWVMQPLEKYKPKPVAPVTTKIELLTSPMAPLERTTVFVRSNFSRELPRDFLETQRIAQEARTKSVAKGLTGVSPLSILHAELLIDAAIERMVISERPGHKSLPGFWSLPVEVRARICQFAMEAEGDFWPVDTAEFHQRNPDTCLRPLADHCARCGTTARDHDRYLIFTSGLIVPRRVVKSLPNFQTDQKFSSFDFSSVHGHTNEDVVAQLVPSTTTLLRASKRLREEAIQVLFVQPTYCFDEVAHLHHFISNLRSDSLSSLRKVRLCMPLDSLLIVFSLARNGLTPDEKEILHTVLLPKNWYDPNRRPPGTANPPRVKLFEQEYLANDAVFVDRSDLMRFTHLSIDVEDSRDRWVFDPGEAHMAKYARHRQLGRLLLVKLVNLTLDFWAQSNDSRPQLGFTWPSEMAEDSREALDVMNQIYKTVQVEDD